MSRKSNRLNSVETTAVGVTGLKPLGVDGSGDFGIGLMTDFFNVFDNWPC